MNEWDRAYMRKPVAHVAPEPEPVAWQWLNTGHMRKKIPKNATNPAHWNPLYAAPPATPAPAVRCPTCNGDDMQAPCAYPEGGQPGCLRDKRLSAAPAVPLTLDQRAMLHDAAHIINRTARTKGDHWDRVGSLLTSLADGIGEAAMADATEWFPANVKPVRVGWYEVQSNPPLHWNHRCKLTGRPFRYWCGKQWKIASPSEAWARGLGPSIFGSHPSHQWRGLKSGGGK